MTGTSKHPEQDPAEGSRGKVERELHRQSDRQTDRSDQNEPGKPTDEEARRTQKGAP